MKTIHEDGNLKCECYDCVCSRIDDEVSKNEIKDGRPLIILFISAILITLYFFL